jgi:hypothetical protein
MFKYKWEKNIIWENVRNLPSIFKTNTLNLRYFLMNNNFIESKRQIPHICMKSIQERQSTQRHLQSKKLTRSKRFEEEKLGT